MNKKNKILSLILLFVMINSVFAGCAGTVETNGKMPSTTAETTTEISTTQEPTTLPKEDYTGVYDDLLLQTYKNIQTFIDDPELIEEDYNMTGIFEVIRELSEEAAMKAVGYSIRDLNSDGIPELLICSVDESKDKKYKGTRILSAYTYAEKSPTLLFEGLLRNEYYLLTDGTIYKDAFSGAATNIFGTFTFPKNSTSIKAKDYYFTLPDNGDFDNILLFHNKTGDFDENKSDRFNGSEDEFWHIQKNLSKKILKIKLKPFEVFSSDSEDKEDSSVASKDNKKAESSKASSKNNKKTESNKASSTISKNNKKPESSKASSTVSKNNKKPESSKTPSTTSKVSKEPSYIYASFSSDTSSDLSNAKRFIADNSEYCSDVVFFAKGEVYNFSFCRLELKNGGDLSFNYIPMYTVDVLTENTPLIVTMSFPGAMPSNGIIYTDSQGITHSGTLSMSGLDGSLILNLQ